jgi:hypothetical protein
MKYYKYKWNELRGDKFDSWGFSLWYFEIGEDDFPNRQIEIYENGKKLKYSENYLEDKYGKLGDQKLVLSEFDGVVCTKIEFEKNWN